MYNNYTLLSSRGTGWTRRARYNSVVRMIKYARRIEGSRAGSTGQLKDRLCAAVSIWTILNCESILGDKRASRGVYASGSGQSAVVVAQLATFLHHRY